MAPPVSRTAPSSPNPSTQGSPRIRDFSVLKTGEPGTAFRAISRGKGSRGGGIKSGRGGGHPPNNSGQKGASHPEADNSRPSPSPNATSGSRKPLALPSITVTSNGTERPVNGNAERGGHPKPGARKQSRAAVPPSPSETSQTAPPTPSRSSNRRRRSQPGKSTTTSAKPSLTAIKPQKSRGGSTPASQMVLRKDIPPHLAAAHEAEIRHDIDALVERVRAVAMAENRPTTPGSHIDWAGDEDDSLPDLQDWGITTNATRSEDKSEEISPILADTLKPLPEPNSEVHQEEEREMETYDDDPQPEQPSDSLTQPPFSLPPSLTKGVAVAPSTSEKAPQECIPPPAVEESTSPTLSNEKPSLHPSLPAKPIAALESLRTRGRSVSRPANLPPKPMVVVAEEGPLTTKTEGLAESIHAPSVEEHPKLECVSSASSSERGLAASIHAPVAGLPESHSAPSLLTDNPSSSRTHSRSQTEGHAGNHPPQVKVPHRRGRSGASSPLGKHVYTHSRNHSTPAGGSRPPQGSRPVITGEAISRLARTIGGLGPTARTQAIAVTKESTFSS